MSEEFREVQVREEPGRFADNLHTVLLSRPGQDDGARSSKLRGFFRTSLSESQDFRGQAQCSPRFSRELGLWLDMPSRLWKTATLWLALDFRLFKQGNNLTWIFLKTLTHSESTFSATNEQTCIPGGIYDLKLKCPFVLLSASL